MKLSFEWIAQTIEDKIVFQYDKDKENRFDLNWFNINALKFFHLYNEEKKILFSVDLQKGFIYFGDHQDRILDFNEEKRNIRLIYKRINRQYINEDTQKIIKHEVWQIFGLQYNDKENNNHKMILQIDSNGNTIFGD